MLITQVSLSDIKNYTEAEFTFEPGTNAICGPNGIGKTTIIEAIAFALFDYLPYKKTDFTRRGTKLGTVRITFQSALDERLYTVVRNTGNVYFVNDDELNIRLAEQKTDTLDWLHEHMALSPTVSLPDLFETTIGVPQGTFTADFKKTATARKAIFDRILRVEEYRQASDKLRDVQRFTENRGQEYTAELAGYDGELKQLPEIVEYLERLHDDSVNLEKSILDQEALLQKKNQELAAMTRQAEQIRQLLAQTDQLLLEKKHVAQTLADDMADLKKAQAAAVILQTTKAGYAAYQQTNEQIKNLDQQRKERDRLARAMNEKEKLLAELRIEFRTVREQLKQIDLDRQNAEELEPLATRQKQLEEILTGLKSDGQRRKEWQQQMAEFEKDAVSLKKRRNDLQTQIVEIEKFRDDADQLAAFESVLQTAENDWQASKELYARQQNWRENTARIERDLDQLNHKLRRLDEQIQAIKALEGLAAEYSRWQEEQARTQADLADLKALLKKDEEILTQVKDGLCPFLRERCKNIPPGQSLDEFFKLEMTDHQTKIPEYEKKLKELDTKLKEAHSAVVKVEQLYGWQQQQAELTEQMTRLTTTRTAIEAELTAHTEIQLADLEKMNAELEGHRQNVAKARTAANKMAQVALITKQVQQVTEDLAANERKTREVSAKIETLAGLDNEIEMGEAELKKLADPFSRLIVLRKNLSQEAQRKTDLANIEQRGKTLNQEVEQLTEALAPYANLDQEWETAQAELKASTADYQRYLAHETIAQTETVFAQKVKAGEEKQHEISSALTELQRQSEKIGELYQAKHHEELQAEVSKRQNDLAVSKENWRLILKQVGDYQQKEDALQKIVAKRDAVIKRQAHNRRLNQVITFSRDTLKLAGPHVTAVYLANISIRADQIFREISGKPYLSLHWTNDYEIMVEEEGLERSFNNLSGGEQMAAALAIRLSLLREMSDIDIAFFDEPTMNMDEIRRRNLAEQIRQIRGFSQLFVISHDDTFERVTDHVVHLGQED